MWRVFRDAGRPWPVLCDDDVIDYMVMEAVALKAKKEEQAQEKAAHIKQWQQDEKERLKQMVR